MPNDPINCPNCGSSDARQSGPNSYACVHCQTKFRWVDPTRVTVAHEPSVCACGNIAKAFCVRCNAPLCNKHKADRADWQIFGVPSFGDDEEAQEEWRHAMAEHRVPDEDGVLCSRCKSECDKVLHDIEESRRRATCATCIRVVGHRPSQIAPKPSTDIRANCFVCGVGLCSAHALPCSKCERTFCGEHARRYDYASDRLFCQKCYSWDDDMRWRHAKEMKQRLLVAAVGAAVLGVFVVLCGFRQYISAFVTLGIFGLSYWGSHDWSDDSSLLQMGDWTKKWLVIVAVGAVVLGLFVILCILGQHELAFVALGVFGLFCWYVKYAEWYDMLFW